MNQKFTKRVLKTIKEKKILPKPKLEFVLKNLAIWLLGILFLLIGSMASAVIIYMVRHNDWYLSDHLSDSPLAFVFATLPYFWLIILALFIFVAYYQIKCTREGYKYRICNIIALIFIFSVLLGQIFYNFGLGQKIDMHLSDNFDFYNKRLCHNSVVWNRPDRGIIIGIVEDVINQEIIIHDLDNKHWQVSINQIKTDPRLSIGNKIKIIGEILNKDHFLADEIRFVPCKCQEEIIIQPCGCRIERKLPN
ncbi:MAG: hypothetical protein ABIG10_02925 [bacterium]